LFLGRGDSKRLFLGVSEDNVDDFPLFPEIDLNGFPGSSQSR